MIAGMGDEVFYFFLLLVVATWYSTATPQEQQVREVMVLLKEFHFCVQVPSVIQVERAEGVEVGAGQVREAVQQFLQLQQQEQETDRQPEQAEAAEP